MTRRPHTPSRSVRPIACLAACIIGCALFAANAEARQLYGSDFEGDPIGSLPDGWHVLFDGKTTASVIADPANPANRILTSSDMAHDQSRHDGPGGSIYGVGEENWSDYIMEFDAYFPADFYMGTIFRYQDGDNFYLFDRRAGGETGTFSFYHRTGGWPRIQNAPFLAEPEKWYRFRISAIGSDFKAYAGLKADNPDFNNEDPFMEGSENTLKTGKFGLYGLIYIDNLTIGETEGDLLLNVEPAGKAAVVWGGLKRSKR